MKLHQFCFLVLALLSLALFSCRSEPPPTTPLVVATPTPTSEPRPTPSPLPPTPTSVPGATNTPRSTFTAVPTSIVSPSPTASPSPTVPPTPPGPSGDAVLGMVGRVESLDPLQDLNPRLVELARLYSRPLLPRSPGSARPLEPLNVSEDGLRITYTLPELGNAAADSLERAIWPSLDWVRAVTATDTGLQISLSEPNCRVVDRLAALPILPLPPAAGVDSSGPFALQRWDALSGTLYLTPARRETNLAELSIQLFEDDETALAALSTGRIDLLPLRHPGPPAPDGFARLRYLAPRLSFISFNNADPVLADERVRQALSLALDRQQVLTVAYGGEATLAGSILPPEHWAATDLPPADFDLEQAAQLLDAAGLVDRDGDGWRDLPDEDGPWLLSLQLDEANPVHTAIAYLAAADYRRVGVRAVAEPVPYFIVLDDLLAHDYQATVFEWAVRPELDHEQRWHSNQIDAELGLNVAAYQNAEVDTWLEAANQVPACDPAERAALYARIQARLAADRPIDVLAFPHDVLLAREDIRSLAPGPFAPFTWNAEDWYLGLGVYRYRVGDLLVQ